MKFEIDLKKLEEFLNDIDEENASKAANALYEHFHAFIYTDLHSGIGYCESFKKYRITRTRNASFVAGIIYALRLVSTYLGLEVHKKEKIPMKVRSTRNKK